MSRTEERVRAGQPARFGRRWTNFSSFNDRLEGISFTGATLAPLGFRCDLRHQPPLSHHRRLLGDVLSCGWRVATTLGLDQRSLRLRESLLASPAQSSRSHKSSLRSERHSFAIERPSRPHSLKQQLLREGSWSAPVQPNDPKRNTHQAIPVLSLICRILDLRDRSSPPPLSPLRTQKTPEACAMPNLSPQVARVGSPRILISERGVGRRGRRGRRVWDCGGWSRLEEGALLSAGVVWNDIGSSKAMGGWRWDGDGTEEGRGSVVGGAGASWGGELACAFRSSVGD